LYFFAFLARNGQTEELNFPTTAFSDRICSDSETIQTKRKRIMGYIKKSPQTKMRGFFIRQTFPPKSICLVLDKSVHHLPAVIRGFFSGKEKFGHENFYNTFLR
jgi:hypothetical protein